LWQHLTLDLFDTSAKAFDDIPAAVAAMDQFWQSFG
jgi:hypothetical protein